MCVTYSSSLFLYVFLRLGIAFRLRPFVMHLFSFYSVLIHVYMHSARYVCLGAFCRPLCIITLFELFRATSCLSVCLPFFVSSVTCDVFSCVYVVSSAVVCLCSCCIAFRLFFKSCICLSVGLYVFSVCVVLSVCLYVFRHCYICLLFIVFSYCLPFCSLFTRFSTYLSILYCVRMSFFLSVFLYPCYYDYYVFT